MTHTPRPNHGVKYRYVSHGQRHGAWTRPPMAPAHRAHVHGKLLPMEYPEGEPSYAKGLAIVLVFALLLAACAVVLP